MHFFHASAAPVSGEEPRDLPFTSFAKKTTTDHKEKLSAAQTKKTSHKLLLVLSLRCSFK